jgi:hypothetical protein
LHKAVVFPTFPFVENDLGLQKAKMCFLDVFSRMSVYARPHLSSSPPGEETLSLVSGFAGERPANPVV